ncbi:hypothetical protein BH23BAC2_BH23BAC2_15730 [soil metagenome]
MIKFGIWSFDEELGLVGTPENLPEHYITTEKLWEIEETSQGQVWKWPLQLARNRWFTPAVADDFNKAFFYAQQYFKEQRPGPSPKSLDFDSRTVKLQTEILSDYFPGPEEEVSFS